MSVSDTNRAFDQILEMLHRRSLQGWEITDLIGELAQSLRDAGMKLCRIQIGRPILHPLYVVGAYTWYRDNRIELDNYTRGPNEEKAFRESPFYPVFKSGENEGRFRIQAGSESDRFPLFVSAAAEGGTDYFIQLRGYDDRSQNTPVGQEGLLISWISAEATGFSDAEIELLRRLHSPLSVEINNLTHKLLVQSILHTYLGDLSADRVYSGQIQRGDGDVIEAVILFCDLRGSSRLAEHYDLDEFLNVLNEYYDVTAGAILDNGGEVLRYIGDASLAIFSIDRHRDSQAACQAALRAADEAVLRGNRLNAAREDRGEPHIEFGIGLHYGKVVYGNIGTASRLEFTVIGKAANEAARIEAQCKELGETILVSREFAKFLDLPWRSHGEFELRNIGHPIEILSPTIDPPG